MKSQHISKFIINHPLGIINVLTVFPGDQSNNFMNRSPDKLSLSSLLLLAAKTPIIWSYRNIYGDVYPGIPLNKIQDLYGPTFEKDKMSSRH